MWPRLCELFVSLVLSNKVCSPCSSSSSSMSNQGRCNCRLHGVNWSATLNSFPSMLNSTIPASGPEVIKSPIAVPANFSFSSAPGSVASRTGTLTNPSRVETLSVGSQFFSSFHPESRMADSMGSNDLCYTNTDPTTFAESSRVLPFRGRLTP